MKHGPPCHGGSPDDGLGDKGTAALDASEGGSPKAHSVHSYGPVTECLPEFGIGSLVRPVTSDGCVHPAG